MKSIDEGFEDHKSKNQTLFRTSKVSFNAGIEFAERWIPVEEELPEENVSVLIRFGSCGRIVVGHLDDGDFEIDYSDEFIPKNITHWRPINHV